MISEPRQQAILNKLVPALTERLVADIDREAPKGTTDYDKRRMATSCIAHVMAALLVDQSPDDQVRFGVMVGELVRSKQ